MFKDKYLIFNENIMPRLLVNPTAHTLAQFPKEQVVKINNLKHIKGIPLEHLILENGVVRKASKNEIIDLSNKVQTNEALKENVMEKTKLVDDIQKKMRELNDSVLLLMDENKEAVKEAEKNLKKWVIIANITGIICVVELAYILVNTGLLK
jgi:hypothetical protein